MGVTDTVFERRIESIVFLHNNTRIQNCLRQANIFTIKDLLKESGSDLLHYKHFGRRCLLDIGTTLMHLGITKDAFYFYNIQKTTCKLFEGGLGI